MLNPCYFVASSAHCTPSMTHRTKWGEGVGFPWRLAIVHFLVFQNNKISQWHITLSNIPGTKLAGSRGAAEVYLDIDIMYHMVRLGLACIAVLLGNILSNGTSAQPVLFKHNSALYFPW